LSSIGNETFKLVNGQTRYPHCALISFVLRLKEQYVLDQIHMRDINA